MKIALLNLPVDNNYGGMLQRYALMTVLQGLGHEVIHINIRFPYNSERLSRRIIRDVKRFILRLFNRYRGPIMPEFRVDRQYRERCRLTDAFYRKYISHTHKIVRKSDILPVCRKSDVIVVGSDQVWRKTIANTFGLPLYFCDFITDDTKKLVAYGVSLGTASNELSKSEIQNLAFLYKRFSAVSVREESGCQLLDEYGWNEPEHIQVLDPTLLLDKEDYFILIEKADTCSINGTMLCYILDRTEDKMDVISQRAEVLGLTPFFISMDNAISVEQWLRSFRDAKYVITDSYHGLVFSIIMEKPFHLFRNDFRGNARFDSLLRLCGIENLEDIDWLTVRSKLEYKKTESINFLKESIR